MKEKLNITVFGFDIFSWYNTFILLSILLGNSLNKLEISGLGILSHSEADTVCFLVMGDQSQRQISLFVSPPLMTNDFMFYINPEFPIVRLPLALKCSPVRTYLYADVCREKSTLLMNIEYFAVQGHIIHFCCSVRLQVVKSAARNKVRGKVTYFTKSTAGDITALGRANCPLVHLLESKAGLATYSIKKKASEESVNRKQIKTFVHKYESVKSLGNVNLNLKSALNLDQALYLCYWR